jgi:YVTN family beta-propeller protein
MPFRRFLPLALCALVSVSATTVPQPVRSSTLAVDASRLVVVNEDSSSITIVDPLTRRKQAEIAVCTTPRTVALSGDVAFVPCADGRIARVELASSNVRMADAGVEPFGVIVAGSRLFVTDHGAAAVRVLDAATLAPIATIATEAYPRGLAFDGRLYVTHFQSGRISVIDVDTLQVTRMLSTGADANLSQSITLARGRAYLPQTRSNTSNRALLFDNTVFPVVNVIDLETGTALTRERIALDIVDQPVNMPFDAAITSGGKMYVVHAGSDDLSAITLEFQEAVAHVETGFNPRGVVLSPDERFVYVNNALSGTVSVIDTATDAVIDTIQVTTIPLAPSLLRGKILFNSSATTTLAKDEWVSCATCHFEGGADGRTWFFRDGIRNTPALFGVASTLPMHWSGDLDELQDVENTIRSVQAGTGLVTGDVHCSPVCDETRLNGGRSQDLDDLALFMMSLRAPRRQVIATERGAELFATHCAECHPAPLYTDRRTHDVGTAGVVERKGNAFDTPSLRGVFDTAPYLHDGSAATIREAVERHTNVRGADAEEVAAFVGALPYPQPKRRSAR